MPYTYNPLLGNKLDISSGRGAYSAIVFEDGDLVVAENNVGAVIKEDTDAATVIQAALDNLTNGRAWKEKVILMGNFTINNSAEPLTIPDFSSVEVYGKLTATTKSKTLLSIGNDVDLFGGVYNGDRGTENGGDTGVRVILVSSKENVLLNNIKVLNGWSRGIEVDYGNNITLRNIYVDNSWRNIMCWVSPSDLASHTGKVTLENIHSINAIENGIDYTYPRMTLDHVYSYDNNVDICADGFLENQFSNIHANSIQLGTGSYSGNVGVRLSLNNIFASKIYSAFNTSVESIKANNVHLKASSAHGWQFFIKSDNNVEYIELNNIEIANQAWSGLQMSRDTGTTGIFKYVILNNCIIRDGAQRGFYFDHVDYLKLTNCIAVGNDWRGFVVKNSNYVKLLNCDAIKTGAYQQEGPLIVESVDYLKAIGCFLEYGGVHTTLTSVTNYDFRDCEGDYPILRNKVLSDSFAIDSTGVKTVTIAHGLDITPSKEDCQLTVVEETDVDDWRFDLLKVDSVDATNVTAKIHVSTASATAGATAKLALRVGKL